MTNNPTLDPFDRLAIEEERSSYWRTIANKLEAENAELRQELEAQAMVNGRGSEREAKLLAACVEYRAKLDELERENAELRDKFATIPDEVWSKADLVKQIHQALAERDDANRKIAALRSLLQDSLEWLDDYGMRMSGTSNLVNRIEIALRKEAQP